MLILFLFILVPFLITGYFAQKVTESMVMHEKQEKLLALAYILDSQLDAGGFNALLVQEKAENLFSYLYGQLAGRRQNECFDTFAIIRFI